MKTMKGDDEKCKAQNTKRKIQNDNQKLKIILDF